MDIFNVLLQPFIWAIDDILLSPNLEIDGIDVWTIILAFNITGFTIYGILQNLGTINLPHEKSDRPEIDHITYNADNSKTVYYKGSKND